MAEHMLRSWITGDDEIHEKDGPATGQSSAAVADLVDAYPFTVTEVTVIDTDGDMLTWTPLAGEKFIPKRPKPEVHHTDQVPWVGEINVSGVISDVHPHIEQYFGVAASEQLELQCAIPNMVDTWTVVGSDRAKRRYPDLFANPGSEGFRCGLIYRYAPKSERGAKRKPKYKLQWKSSGTAWIESSFNDHFVDADTTGRQLMDAAFDNGSSEAIFEGRTYRRVAADY